VSVVRCVFDDGWRLNLVDTKEFWETLSVDEDLPFRTMSLDPAVIHQLSFYHDLEPEYSDEDLYTESRFDFLVAYLPRPSDVQGSFPGEL
jgi:hypothetical protein